MMYSIGLFNGGKMFGVIGVGKVKKCCLKMQANVQWKFSLIEQS